MTDKRLEEIRQLVAGAQITTVRLTDLQARCRIRDLEEIGEDAGLLIGQDATGSWEGEGKRDLVIRTALEARVAVPKEEAEPFVLVRAVFEVHYQISGAEAATEEQLKAFAETNGVFNVWPYFRETVQSVTGRMGLPSLVLPLFRFGQTIGATESPMPAPGQEGEVDEPTANRQGEGQ